MCSIADNIGVVILLLCCWCCYRPVAGWIRTLPLQSIPGEVPTLAIDYGLGKSGIALGRGSYAPARPLGILRPATLPALMEYMRTYQVQQVVLGWPLHKNGTMAEQTQLTEAFGTELKAEVVRELGPQVAVFVCDERYTSQAASAQLSTRRESEKYVDAEAACIILDSFFRDGGVLQTIELDDELYEKCMKVFEARQAAQERNRLDEIEKREARILRRKKAIADMQEDNLSQMGTMQMTSKKKKKKRRRR